MKAEPEHCPSAAVLEQLLAEQLTDPDLGSIETHVERCESCQERLEEMIGKSQVRADGSEPDDAFESQDRKSVV